MSIDASLTKNYGFAAPLTLLEEHYWELIESVDSFISANGDLLVHSSSGSFSMRGATIDDVFIVGVTRLFSWVDVQESNGVAWRFHSTATPEESALLLEVAKKFFNLDNPTLEHIVALSYS